MDTSNIGSTARESTQPGQAVVCPVCGSPLQLGDKSAACTNNHTFDRAREGYFNLLLANQKGSNDPGDDKDAVAARRAFLSAGHYDFLRDALAQAVPAETDTLLDAGCGEGSFLGSVPHNHGFGVDISKSAIRLAARANRDITWIVANVARTIPLADDSCDTILSVMAPRNAAEFRRILRPGGTLICVIPGPGHLKQLTDLLMDHDPNQSAKPKALLEDLTPGFGLRGESRVSRDLQLDQAAVSNLVTMTPLRWKSRKQSLETVQNLGDLTVNAHFTILNLRVTSG